MLKTTIIFKQEKNFELKGDFYPASIRLARLSCIFTVVVYLGLT